MRTRDLSSGHLRMPTLAEIAFDVSDFRSVLRKLKGQREAGSDGFRAPRRSCSGLNFLCFGLFAAACMAVDRYRACTVRRGDIVDTLIRHFLLVACKVGVSSNHLPARRAGDLIFELRAGRPVSPTRSQPGALATWRDRSND